MEVVAVNDPFTPVNFMAYALKYDLAHSRDRWRQKKESGVRVSPTGQLLVGGKAVEVFDKQDSSRIPWEAVGVNYVVETVPPLCEVAEARRHLREKGSQGRAVQDMLKGKIGQKCFGINCSSLNYCSILQVSVQRKPMPPAPNF